MRLSIEHQATRVCESSEYLFGREAFAKSLSNIFSNSESGFVLAIDATWGAGKTAFIHQLIHDLKATEKIIPIYYDAFSNDFSNDTFLSIGATIFHEVEGYFESTGKSVKVKKQLEHLKDLTKKTAGELIKLSSNLALKSLTAGMIDNSELEKIAIKTFNSATFGTLELELNEKFKAYENAKSNIQSYVDALESVSQNGEKVIFFIDELDRCRPDFAVEVLEKVKHLFAAKNVIFVISYNKSQLSKIISHVYGVENKDALKYLEKFIHIEANLPVVDEKSSTSSYEQLFDSFVREFNIELPNQQQRITSLKNMFTLLCQPKHLNMNSREIERAFSYVSFCFAALPKEKGSSLFEFFLPAAMMKVKNSEIFNQVSEGRFFSTSANYKWLHDFFKEHYKSSLTPQASNVFYVKQFEEACGIVSMFKMPTDDIIEDKI
ncbi:P-loop NTPase fold protein [Vibrio diabolicus]|uniref:KAP family P-loop NTPase fold protein n=1 Tax=Vibrio harveyi group TaxID=717610 RepID=UPI0037514B11